MGKAMGTPSDRLRIAIIGAGVVAANHARAFASNPDAQLVAVADVDARKGEAMAAQYGAEFFRDYHDLFRRARLDAVSVCVPHDLHRDVGFAAAQTGLHILMEKPITIALDDADQMLEACARARVLMMVGFVHRFREEQLTAKRFIDDRAIGKPMHILDSICTRGGQHPPAWVWRRSKAGGGVLMYGGIHSIDRLRWLMGSEVREVYAQKLLYSNSGEVDVEDGLSAVLIFKSGGLGNLFENSPAYGNPGGWLTEVYGDSGAIRVKNGGWLEITRPGSQETLSFDPYDHFQREIDEFVAAIKDRRQPWITGEDGRQALAVAQAIYRSAESGRPVTVS